MKSKTTAIWFVLAAALAVAIWFLDDFLQPPSPSQAHLFAGLQADLVTD